LILYITKRRTITLKYRRLANTGTSVSNLALGAMDFRSKIDETEAFAILDRFIEAGGNLVDTANVYGGGKSEKLLGRWLADRPADVTDRVVLATKARFDTGPDVNENGSSRRNLDRALTASLRRLGRERIDLYQLHGWDPLTSNWGTASRHGLTRSVHRVPTNTRSSVAGTSTQASKPSASSSDSE
jgi:aryl-alcohol dehydrogenase-like predicted oxidoreductase